MLFKAATVGTTAVVSGAVTAFAAGGELSFNWEINVGNIVTWTILLCSALIWLTKAHSNLELVKGQTIVVQEEIEEIKEELKTITEILTTLGRYEERFLNIAAQTERHELELSNLRQAIAGIGGRKG